MLVEIFGTEMTGVASRCAHCGNRARLAPCALTINGPGVVLRCSICTEIVMRVMRRPDGSFLVDARGATYLRMLIRAPCRTGCNSGQGTSRARP